MKIIAVAGMPGAGKTESLKYFQSKNIPTISMGDVIINEMRKRNLEVNHKSIGEFATKIRKDTGMDAAAKLCVPYILEKNNDLIFIDGIRSYEEIEFFQKTFTNDFILIAIHTPQPLRYERIMVRNQERDTKSWEDFIARDHRELDWGLGKTISLAHFEIDNTSSLENLHQQLESTLEKINSVHNQKTTNV